MRDEVDLTEEPDDAMDDYKPVLGKSQSTDEIRFAELMADTPAHRRWPRGVPYMLDANEG